MRGSVPQNCANGKMVEGGNGKMGATAVVLYTDGSINCMRQANEALQQFHPEKYFMSTLLNCLFTGDPLDLTSKSEN